MLLNDLVYKTTNSFALNPNIILLYCDVSSAKVEVSQLIVRVCRKFANLL